MLRPPGAPEGHQEATSPDVLYGSDKNGLVWGYMFSSGGPPRNVASEDLKDGLAACLEPHPESFLWLHFSLSNKAAERWFRGHLDLPENFYDGLRQEPGSTRVEQEGDSLVAVIHDVLFDSKLDISDVPTVVICIGPRFLISARLKPLRSIDLLRAQVKAGKPFRSPAELLARLLQAQSDVLVDIVRQSTRRVDGIEDRLLTDLVATSRRELGTLRRTLVRLQRLLAPEPAALFRLLNSPPEWLGEEDVQDLRQAAEEFSTAVVDSAALVERLKLLQEESASLLGEQTNRTLFTLTVVTVIALPINLVAGLFGMNVGGIPLAGTKAGFFIIVAGLAAFTVLLASLALGRRRE